MPIHISKFSFKYLPRVQLVSIQRDDDDDLSNLFKKIRKKFSKGFFF